MITTDVYKYINWLTSFLLFKEILQFQIKENINKQKTRTTSQTLNIENTVDTQQKQSGNIQGFKHVQTEAITRTSP